MSLSVIDPSGMSFTPVNKAGDTMTSALKVFANTWVDGGHAIQAKNTSTQGDTATRIAVLANTNAGGSQDWYLTSNVNNTFALHQGSVGDRLLIDTAGRVTTPAQPCFHVYAASYGIPDSYWFKLEGFAYTDFNVGGHWSSSAQRFTAPVTGNYVFYAGGWATANASGERYAYSFSVNGGGFAFIGGGNYCLGDSPMVGYSRQIRLNAGDYVDAYMFSAVGCTLGGPHMFEFGGYLLG